MDEWGGESGRKLTRRGGGGKSNQQFKIGANPALGVIASDHSSSRTFVTSASAAACPRRRIQRNKIILTLLLKTNILDTWNLNLFLDTFVTKEERFKSEENGRLKQERQEKDNYVKDSDVVLCLRTRYFIINLKILLDNL